jgi:hypothetical protein
MPGGRLAVQKNSGPSAGVTGCRGSEILDGKILQIPTSGSGGCPTLDGNILQIPPQGFRGPEFTTDSTVLMGGVLFNMNIKHFILPTFFVMGIVVNRLLIRELHYI